MNLNKYIIYIFFLLSILFTGCSTTKNLPKGEVLYIGVKEMKVDNPENYEITPDVKSQVEKALSVAPNNSFFGSCYTRLPFPFGLWIYNSFKTDKKKGLKHWIFEKLAANPVLISDVDPSLRAKVAETLMNDNGYFDGSVKYEIIPDKKDDRKAKIEYIIDYNHPFTYSTIEYIKTNTPADSLIEELQKNSLLKENEIFNVNTLEDERSRISNYLRSKGYYYFRPDFITYMADSTLVPYKIALRLLVNNNLPVQMTKPWKIGDIGYSINNSYGRVPNDTIFYKDIRISYRNKKPMRSKVLYKSLDLHKGDTYSPEIVTQTQTQLNRLNSFKFVEINFYPNDTLSTCDTLNVNIVATMDLPIDAELELNVTTKSNDQTGPGASLNITRRNIFKGGEILNTELTGSYEWQTGEGSKNSKGHDLINSYEFGATVSVIFPRLIAPKFFNVDSKYSATTNAKINGDILNRGGFFRLLNIGGSMGYDFKTSPYKTHSVTPFSLKYSYLMNTTNDFDSIMKNNQALALSFQDQFIPSMGYTFTYDNSTKKDLKNYLWWQTSVVSAGNILYGVMALCGNKQGNNKTILGKEFSQFAKLVSEIRVYHLITKKNIIAGRFIAGAVKPYLNSKVVPYSEQFFIGGANSLRGFGVRTVGPGSYHPAHDALYSYLDQTGNLKLEANLEYRFPLFGSLNGALFTDAGNIWLLKKDESRPGGEFSLKTLGKDIALDVGFGLRFDITFIVLRLDIGIPIHAPYETEKTGYYNIPHFWKGLGWHFAIGYPF